MQQKNTFQAGLQQDTDPQFQPPDSYPDARHLVHTAGDHLEQERGALLLPSRPLAAVIGGCVLGDQEILACADGSLGVLSGGAYSTLLSGLILGAQVSLQARLDYRGHRLVYLADGTQFSFADLDEPAAGLQPLLPAPALPLVEVAAVDSSGELPTGIYQACVCLLSASKNPISYSLFTNPVPVVNEPAGTERTQLDGAPPQTPAGGSIRFSLSQLPTRYSYAQLIVATYVGSANALTLHRLPLIALAGRTSLDYTYASESEQQEPVELSEVLGTLADYASASVLLQKDGHLLAAGLRSAEPVQVNWQAIANAIILGPVLEQVPFTEAGAQGADYKNPLTTTNRTGYRRDEVYSFCLVPIVNGRRLDAYHIPGLADPAHPLAAQAFRTYYSRELYPDGQGHVPGAAGNLGIRHHRMPSMQMAPLLFNANATSATLRILGVSEVLPPDFSGLPLGVRSQLDGYLIGVQPRRPEHRSILAQGIAQPLVPTKDARLMVSPFNGRWPAIRGDAQDSNELPGNGQYGAFYSPETTILGSGASRATQLSIEALMSGSSLLVASERGKLERKDKYAHLFFNYQTLDANITHPPVPLLNPINEYVAPADGYSADLSEESNVIYTWQQNGYLLLKADLVQAPLGFYTGLDLGNTDVLYIDFSGATDEVILRRSATLSSNQSNGPGGISSRLLYNLRKSQLRQYGKLEQAIYHPVVLRRTGQPQPAPAFFGGDTFLTKVALQSNTAERWNADDAGLQFRSLNYFFCESGVNTDYRHFLPALQATRGTLPYYPRLQTLWADSGTGVMQYPSSLGHPTGYNRQYSFQNTLTPLLPRDSSVEQVVAFPNRVIYSEPGVEGEQLDAYRIFRANNYHDVPRNTGPITDLWAWAGTLYLHTSQALYKAFFNEATTQTTSQGEVVLGNGGLFPRPSVPVLGLDGGFAGCQHPRASVSSPAGRFFTDVQGRQQYLFNGQLQELSASGLRRYFRTQLGGAPPLALTASYDYANERFTLYNLPGGALSWSARSQRWTSFHDAAPSFCLSSQRRTLLEQQGLAEQNAGAPLACSLSIIASAPPDAAKTFSNLVLDASRLPASVQQATASQQSPLATPVLKLDYGQQAAAGQSLFTEANYAHQGAVGRDQASEARLKGKWLRSTTAWATAAVPVLIRQLTVLFRQSYR